MSSLVVSYSSPQRSRLAACLNRLARFSDGLSGSKETSSVDKFHERFKGRSPYDSSIANRVPQPGDSVKCAAST
jgi:hypothetical protein